MTSNHSRIGVDVRSTLSSSNSRAWVACLGLLVFGCSKEEPASAPSTAPSTSAATPSAPVDAVLAEKPPEAPGSAPSAKLAAGSQCAGICTRSTELGCSQAGQCERVCNETLAGAPCSSEMSAATACMLSHPVSDWQCAPDGLAAIKDGICVAEQEAVAACVARMLGGGAP